MGLRQGGSSNETATNQVLAAERSGLQPSVTVSLFSLGYFCPVTIHATQDCQRSWSQRLERKRKSGKSLVEIRGKGDFLRSTQGVWKVVLSHSGATCW